ncbi:hypothetical protein K435DRAFT_777938 [Dendrothele bispora CBS 962.96]|uniref:Protein kinase domain-containing protein n=1 Tax=Dendrothele bispora (strain CBS 962.96) TaxID=1314807 RepID=A0A4S8M5W9_DENBC|nr:hypothetical protein K435DRAFT_777938 [Dendrothele bispora CBS 962.96]
MQPHSAPAHGAGHLLQVSRNAATQVFTTLQARGVASQLDFEHRHEVNDVNAYLEQDILNRVVIPSDAFLEQILSLDADGLAKLKENEFKKVKEDERCGRDWQVYVKTFGNPNTKETALYGPLVNFINSVLAVLFPYKRSRPLVFYNGSEKPTRGCYTTRKPDIPEGEAPNHVDIDVRKMHIYWPTLDTWLELKRTLKGSMALDTRQPVVSMKLDGEALSFTSTRLRKSHLPRTVCQLYPFYVYQLRSPSTASSSRGIEAQAVQTSQQDVQTSFHGLLADVTANNPPETPVEPTAGISTLVESHENAASDNQSDSNREKKRQKGKGGRKLPKLTKGRASSDEMDPDEEDNLVDTDRQFHTQLQCAGYGLEMLSSGLIKSHSVGIIMDSPVGIKSTFLQLAYYDRSKVILSEAIEIAKADDDDLSQAHNLDLFLAVLHQLCTLSDREQGRFQSNGDGKLFPTIKPPINPRYPVSRAPPIDDRSQNFSGSNAFHGCELLVDDKTFKLGEILYRAHGIIGRGTTVIRAKCDGEDVIVKLSFPGVNRPSEASLINEVREMAENSGHHWALNHLPKIPWSKDYELTDTPQSRLAVYLKNAHIPYKLRLLRITAQEPLKSITDPDFLKDQADYAQVFFDILQIHRWLIDHPKIFHRDISLTNIMYRKEGNVVYGVLNDLDLSTRLPPPDKATSQQRTGTKPYMSHDLLNVRWDKGHAYRHDLESLFYVMLIFCSNYDLKKVGPKNKKEPRLVQVHQYYGQWFSATNFDVYQFKGSWLRDASQKIQVTPFFSGFGNIFYLESLRKILAKGHSAKDDFTAEKESYLQAKEQGILAADDRSIDPGDFDWCTLNGNVTYEQFKRIMKDFCIPLATSPPSNKWRTLNLLTRYENHLPLNPSIFQPRPKSNPTTAN